MLLSNTETLLHTRRIDITHRPSLVCLSTNQLGQLFSKIKRDKRLLCRHAAGVLSCLEKIDCEGSRSGVNYRWQSAMGSAEAHSYLCSSDVRDGK